MADQTRIGPVFNPEAMQRIRETVRTVEGWGDGRGSPGQRSRGPAAYHGWLARASEFAVAGNVIDFELMSPDGSKGNEVGSGQSFGMFIREGLVFENGIYRVVSVCVGSDAAFEVCNPVLRFRGIAAEDIDEDQTGDVAVYRRSSSTGYEDTGKVLESLNDIDIDVGSGAVCIVSFDDLDDDGNALWRIDNADFTCPAP